MITFAVKVECNVDASEAQSMLFEHGYRWQTQGTDIIYFYDYSKITGPVYIHCYNNKKMVWCDDILDDQQEHIDVILFDNLRTKLPKSVTDNIQDSLR